MSIRIIPICILVLGFAADASAQNRIRWRPGQIAGGLAYEIERAFTPAATLPEEEPSEASPVTPATASGEDINRRQPRLTEGSVQHWTPARNSTGRHEPLPGNMSTTKWRSEPVRNHAVSVNDVVELVKSGLGESTIIRYVQDNGVQKRLSVKELIHLHEQGVSEPVITAFQNASVVGLPQPASQPQSQPVPATRWIPETVEPKNELMDAKYGTSVVAPAETLDLPPPPK